MDDEESWLYGGGGEEDQAGGGEAQTENPDSGSKDVQEVRKYIRRQYLGYGTSILMKSLIIFK